MTKEQTPGYQIRKVLLATGGVLPQRHTTANSFKFLVRAGPWLFAGSKSDCTVCPETGMVADFPNWAIINSDSKGPPPNTENSLQSRSSRAYLGWVVSLCKQYPLSGNATPSWQHEYKVIHIAYPHTVDPYSEDTTSIPVMVGVVRRKYHRQDQPRVSHINIQESAGSYSPSLFPVNYKTYLSTF